MANGKAEVALEQLRGIERTGMASGSHREEDGCPVCGAPDQSEYDEDGEFRGPQPVPHAADCWLAAAIAEAERLDPLNGWVPVGERLPFAPGDKVQSKRYAVVCDGERHEAFFGPFDDEYEGESFGWHWDVDEMEEWCCADNITHWHDLPLLPGVKP